MTDDLNFVVSEYLSAQYPKTCNTCGTVHTAAGWSALPAIGMQHDSVESLELRNCGCGSTLAVVVAIHDPDTKASELALVTR